MPLHLLARPPRPAAPAAATVWKMLLDRQQALLHRRVRPEWMYALSELGLRRDTLPNLPALARQVGQRTGWTLLFTGTPVGEAAYYAALARYELPIVSRLRTFGEFDRSLDGPDLFADVLGRLPLLLEPGYAQALQQLGQVGGLASTPATVGLLRRFAQATFELGLLARPGGQPTPYGTTLLTSPLPLHALAAAPPAQLQPLAGAARQLALAAAPETNPTYFVAQSWRELHTELTRLGQEVQLAQRQVAGSTGRAAEGRAPSFAVRHPGLCPAS